MRVERFFKKNLLEQKRLQQFSSCANRWRGGGSLGHGIEKDPEAECSLLGGILSMPAFTGGDGGGVGNPGVAVSMNASGGIGKKAKLGKDQQIQARDTSQ